MIVYPGPLRPGGHVRVVAPSGSPKDESDVDAALQVLRNFGFRVSAGESVFATRHGYLAAQDTVRADDLNSAFADPSVDAIVCLKGGYGTPRILDMLDYHCIRANPKVFVGYSDITALHLAFLRHAGLPTIHGFMAMSFTGEIDKKSQERWVQVVTADSPVGDLPIDDADTLQTVCPGVVDGRLVGGNLSLVAALVGTDYALEPDGAIIFLEDVGEEPYRIDRMLNQLRLAGYFSRCSGIVLGSWNGCTPDEPDRSISLHQVFEDYFGALGKPVLAGFPAGHGTPALTLPLGVRARLDADTGTLSIRESVTGT